MNVTITIPVEIPIESICDLIISAVEAPPNYGCGYWARVEKGASPDYEKLNKYLQSINEKEVWYAHWPVFGGSIIIVEHEENNKKHTLNYDVIKNGLINISQGYPEHLGRILNESTDASIAEEFLQICIFNELKYG